MNTDRLNVFKDFRFAKRYYWTHPWKLVEDWWINLKNAWYRATRGYCYTDLWNMDDWFLTVFPAMLRELAEKHSAYPGQPPFETPEKWERWLVEMAENLEYVNSDPDTENEYAEALTAAMDNCREERNEKGFISYTLRDEDKELKDKYFNRTKELEGMRRQVLEDTMSELALYLKNLWD